jgi:hypothetical protein
MVRPDDGRRAQEAQQTLRWIDEVECCSSAHTHKNCMSHEYDG